MNKPLLFRNPLPWLVLCLASGCYYEDYSYYEYSAGSQIKIPPITRPVARDPKNKLKGGVILGTGTNKPDDELLITPESSIGMYLTANLPYSAITCGYATEGPYVQLDLYPLALESILVDISGRVTYYRDTYYPSATVYLIRKMKNFSPYLAAGYAKVPSTIDYEYSYYDSVIDGYQHETLSDRSDAYTYILGAGIDYNQLENLGIHFGVEFMPKIYGKAIKGLQYYYYDYDVEPPVVVDTTSSYFRITIGTYIKF